MNSIQNIMIEVNNQMHELCGNLPCVRADKVGLDSRAGWVFVGEDCIIVEGSTRAIDYYGGFEYVDSECRTQLGEYTIYMADNDRVQDCLDVYAGEEEESTVEE